jgi:ribosomal protein S18 acetylase RimI-like enzyme
LKQIETMIEPAQEDDGPEILLLTANAGVFKPTEVATVAEIWSEYLREGAQGSGYYLIVYRETEELLGYACYGPHPLTEGTFDLYWIAVDRAHRGLGIGLALLQAVEEGVHSLGGRMITVETSGTPEYAPARHVYASAGYLDEARLKDFYSPGDDLVIYTKHIES